MNSKAKAMGIKRIDVVKCYRFVGMDGGIEVLDFIPVWDVPGRSYEVAYNGKLMGKYLGPSFSISQHDALDMLDSIRKAERN